MIVKLSGLACVDARENAPERETLFLVDGCIAHFLPPDRRVDAEYHLVGHVAMPGGIDLHTHIGGGKVNIARLLMPPSGRDRPRAARGENEEGIAPLSAPVPCTWEAGRRYLAMGYTACFEPAMLPAGARHAHAEMADTPWLDTGAYVLLGNERLLLEAIAQGASDAEIADYVRWMVSAHAACAVKVVNAGGIDAFKFNRRSFDVDEPHPVYGITPRRILQQLARGVASVGLAHPLHVHCSNLGMAGNIDSTLATIDAVEGERLHLAHAQFHCYGNEGPHGFSSAAEQLAERVNRSTQLTIDVGQVLFGQTVTLSADTMHQFDHRMLARPRKGVFQDLECQAGCGVLPFRYRESQYVHSLQWTIGLELFLRIEDPTRVFLTTDHPNGGPFTGYPHLIRLLMDYDFRMSIFDRLHPEVKKTSPLPSLRREYRLQEIVAMTRLGPARALGLADRGTLEEGAMADVVVYRQDANREHMFAQPRMVFRRGELVFRDGEFLKACEKSTVLASSCQGPEGYAWSQNAANRQRWQDHYGYSPWVTCMRQEELLGERRSIVVS